MPRYIDPDTGAVLEYIPPPSVTLASAGKHLQDVFKNNPEKTLKLQMRENASLAEAVEVAYSYVQIPNTHTRVEAWSR